MLFTNLLSVLTAAVVAQAASTEAIPGPGPGQWYHMPARGYESVSARFYIDPGSTWRSGYYMSTSWIYTKSWNELQYFGLQPRTAGDGPTTGRLVYSVFGNGTRSTNKRCSNGADGGAGTSCSLNINFQAGQWYRIESKIIAKTATENRWEGTFIDEGTGVRTVIADFYTPVAFGGLNDAVAQWLEWYKYNLDGLKPATRNCTAKFGVHFEPPIGYHPTTGEKQVAKPWVPFVPRKDDACAVAANRPNWDTGFDANGLFWIKAGVLTP
ncbi:hypothetical protein CspHIS471_0500040 [Cutaneotrichosporon sp. HIS471]|nr:hypothetical protein CspHIS471_0500040 [Cutaneotrichosporon sp. HIS471]